MATQEPTDKLAAPTNFLREMVEEDLRTGRTGGRVATRFPPEPNGYLHIGHAKAICINFGIARDYQGTCNLRFDDTNPTTEDVEYVDSIQEDIRWLGFDWEGRMYYASDYFEQLYQLAVQLIRDGKAYVDSSSEQEIRECRGNFYKEGRPTPYRDRSVEENLDLFARMRAGEFPDGAHVLRAKIDLTAANMNMRDPLLYRIKRAHHHRTGDRWCIYPMYDFAHPLSDAIEQITHSLCSLEFEAHRPLYDWFVRETGSYPSRQTEFARLNVTYTVLSKRKLLQLVEQGLVAGWDDPRMPTLAGMRRRGFPPDAIRAFCDRIGVAKTDSIVDVALLEHAVREELNRTCPRVMAVLRPLRVIIDNYPEGQIDELEIPNSPEDPALGSRKVPFGRELFIEREDFREDPPKLWHRLAPGREVRLRYACLLTCTGVVKDAQGEVTELHCHWDPESRGGRSPDGRTVKGTIHWVSAQHAVAAEVRLYDRLFDRENPNDIPEGHAFTEYLNPRSLEVLTGCLVEPQLLRAAPQSRWQFERLGYFCVDPATTAAGRLVFNRTITLKDTWAKLETKLEQAPRSSKAVPSAPAGPPVPEASSSVATGPAPATGEPVALPLVKRTELEPLKAEVTIDDFARVDLRIGLVREASPVEGAKKLVRLGIDLGEGRLRQIFAGIRGDYPDPAVLLGRQVIVVANLKPRQMKWGLSEGMVLAGGSPEHGFRIATFDTERMPGDRVS